MAGFYSWICFIDAQRGAWFGPISYNEIDDYEAGFALDDNIKSWTEFTYYERKPTEPLTCYFSRSKRVLTKNPPVPKTVTFAQCVAQPVSKLSKTNDLIGTARLLLYNSSGTPLSATLSEHDGRKAIPGRPDWAQWRFNDEYPDHTYLLRVYHEDTVVLRIDLRPVGLDIHIQFFENSQGYYYRFNEPW